MKCPRCRGMLVEIKVYGKTYLMCNECQESGEKSYWTPDLKEIEDITEYKNRIRRKALKKRLNIAEIDEDQE